MKLNWFIRRGIIYIPASIGGWVILTIAAVYAICQFIAISSRSHSTGDTLVNFIFNLLVIGMIYSVIACFSEVGKAD